MAKDAGWHRAVREGMRRSAAARKCPVCGRHGALVEHWKTEDGKVLRGEWCRWARDSDGRLCAYEGEFIESAAGRDRS